MGDARRRGTLWQRREQAIAAGRVRQAPTRKPLTILSLRQLFAKAWAMGEPNKQEPKTPKPKLSIEQ